MDLLSPALVLLFVMLPSLQRPESNVSGRVSYRGNKLPYSKIKVSLGISDPIGQDKELSPGSPGTHLASNCPTPSYLGPCQCISEKWRRKKQWGEQLFRIDRSSIPLG